MLLLAAAESTESPALCTHCLFNRSTAAQTICFASTSICIRSIQHGRRASRTQYFVVQLAAVRTNHPCVAVPDSGWQRLLLCLQRSLRLDSKLFFSMHPWQHCRTINTTVAASSCIPVHPHSLWACAEPQAGVSPPRRSPPRKIYISKIKSNSCEIEDFVETHIFASCV